MSIAKERLIEFDQPHQFNMVNLDDERFMKLGLQPLYLTVSPKYINLHDHIFFSAGISHYECNLANDIECILKILNSNQYGRFEDVYGYLNDDYPVRYKIFNRKIFFDDLDSLNVYKSNPEIRKLVNQKYGLSEDFYEPTKKEIDQDYGEKYLRENYKKYGRGFEYCRVNLTPKEYYDKMMSFKRRELSPYESQNELNAYALRNWLNYNANLFGDRIISRDTTGVYNEHTMQFINTLLETKLDIYNFFDAFSKQVNNWQKVVKELLIELGVYSDFVPNEIDDSQPFDNDGMFDERNHWDNMFHQATPDMLVQFIGFDKIETQIPRTITTSKQNIYEYFFNLLLLEYNIVQIPKLIFDCDKQEFRWIHPKDFINSGINRECEKEIKLIKKYVPYEDRYKYFI